MNADSWAWAWPMAKTKQMLNSQCFHDLWLIITNFSAAR